MQYKSNSLEEKVWDSIISKARTCTFFPLQRCVLQIFCYLFSFLVFCFVFSIRIELISIPVMYKLFDSSTIEFQFHQFIHVSHLYRFLSLSLQLFETLLNFGMLLVIFNFRSLSYLVLSSLKQFRVPAVLQTFFCWKSPNFPSHW